MKKIIVSLVAAAICMSASAQIVSTRSSQKTVSHDNLQRVTFTYSPVNLTDLITLKGTSLALGYMNGFGISSKAPLYLEFGGNVAYTFKSDNDLFGKINALSLQVPVQVTYRVAITDEFVLAPYAGLYARVNVFGKFDDEDMFGEDMLKRFQLGWRIGANVQFNRIYFGVGYMSDIVKLDKDSSFGGALISVGYAF